MPGPHAGAPHTLHAGSLPGVKNIIAVGAGKGGVGKSTAAVLLAVGLKRRGARVGLLDADVYGPSIPTMMGVRGAKPEIDDEQRMYPVDGGGIGVMSIGFLVNPREAVIWRGPMVHGVVQQFLRQVAWGELDYLIVDLPPGTGDVPLTLSQSIPMTGSVVVCTPQDVALQDAMRAAKMYETLNVPSLGIIENMSYYLCPHCGHRDEVFDSGGAAEAAEALGVPFLGALPLNTAIRRFGDAGTPEQCFSAATSQVQQALDTIVGNFIAQVRARNEAGSTAPTLSIE